MVKRQRKGFWARLLSLVVVVLILAAAAILRDGRILGHDLREAHEAKALKNDTLEVTPDGAFVVNTKPLAKDVQGFGGPVPLKIHIKDGRVAAVEAEPNAESPDFFNRAKELLNHWQGKSVDEALAEEVDAVSGATFSSRAIIANMQRGLAYAKQHGQWGEDGSVGALGTSAPPDKVHPLNYLAISCHRRSAGTSASTHICSFDTGWTNSTRREWSEMLPSGLLRGAPYFRSPFIGHPMCAS